jgi:hypothetical protein
MYKITFDKRIEGVGSEAIYNGITCICTHISRPLISDLINGNEIFIADVLFGEQYHKEE